MYAIEIIRLENRCHFHKNEETFTIQGQNIRKFILCFHTSDILYKSQAYRKARIH
jgi:uncharacterized CHY-type Zn-finger protein